MYEAYWGLDDSPFQGRSSGPCFFRSATHDEALARLHFLVDHGCRLGLLLGPEGSGKSLTFNQFARELRVADRQVAVINLMATNSRDFLSQLATQLLTDPRPDDSSFTLWQRLADRLRESDYQQLATVVLLDDADDGSTEVMSCVNRLVQVDSRVTSRLTTVLTSGLGPTRHIPSRLADLCSLKIELEPWTLEETSRYLDECMTRVGGRSGVFDSAAISQIQSLSGGIARKVRDLAELALLAGAGKQLERVDRATVATVYQELSIAR